MGRGDLSRPINFWQKGFFDFTILTEEKLIEKFNDIHYNPVKGGWLKGQRTIYIQAHWNIKSSKEKFFTFLS